MKVFALLISLKQLIFAVVALIDIKHSFKDPHNILENWDENAVDPCSWTMVTCSPDGLVVSL